MQGTLSKLNSWELDRQSEDIRGWAIRDLQGRSLGRVAELVVDTDDKHVTEIVLGDGRRLPAHDIGIGDHVLMVLPHSESATRYRESFREKTPVGGIASAGAGAIAGAISRAGEAIESVKESVKESARELRPASRVEEEDVIVPLIEEEVDFGKRQVERGTTRVFSHVVEKPFEQKIKLRDEHVSVERRKLNEPVSISDAEARMNDRSLEITAVSEYPITEKHLRVKEELVVGKQIEEHEERLTEKVRRTSVEVTELPASGEYSKEGKKS